MMAVPLPILGHDTQIWTHVARPIVLTSIGPLSRVHATVLVSQDRSDGQKEKGALPQCEKYGVRKFAQHILSRKMQQATSDNAENVHAHRFWCSRRLAELLDNFRNICLWMMKAFHSGVNNVMLLLHIGILGARNRTITLTCTFNRTVEQAYDGHCNSIIWFIRTQVLTSCNFPIHHVVLFTSIGRAGSTNIRKTSERRTALPY